MKETEFQAIYEEYHNAKNEKEQNKALEKLHEQIYAYAMKRHKKDFDTASDFYLYVYDKIELMLKEFNPTRGVLFISYVAVKLRFQWLKFLRKDKILREDAKSDQNNAYHCYIIDERPEISQEKQEEREIVKELLDNAMQSLEVDDQICIRLYHGLAPTYALMMSLARKHEALDFFPKFRVFNKQLREKLSQETLQREKIITRLKLQLHKEDGGDDTIKEKLINDFWQCKPVATQETISELMNCSIAQIHRRLKRANKALKLNLEDLI